MPCNTLLLKNQTISERKIEIRETIARLSAELVAGRIKPVVGKQGAIAFQGWADTDRNRITDACAYRGLMSSGSALARAALSKAEALAGRSVDRRVVAQGAHSHDGGATWHDHKG